MNQGEFQFDATAGDRGYSGWVNARAFAAHDLARRIGLPLGHEVEVMLIGGIRLRGKLHLAEQILFVEEARLRHLELAVDRVGFTYREMESCVRLD